MVFSGLKRLSNFSMWIGGIFMLAMMIHITADVFMKYVFNQPILGTLEIVSTYYMVAGVFLPIAAVEMARGSIGVDVAYQFMPRSMKIFCTAVTLLGSAAVYLVLVWTSWKDAVRSFNIGEMMMGSSLVIVWPSRFAMPISLVLAGLVCVYYLIGLFASADLRERLIALDAMPDSDANG